MNNNQSYFIRIRGKIIGPFGNFQLVSLRDRGQLKPFHEVSSDRIIWNPASSLADIFPQKIDKTGDGQQKNIVIDKHIDKTDKVPENQDRQMSDQWFYINNNDEKIGPLSKNKIEALAKKGKILSETSIWNSSFSEWQQCSEVFPDLFIQTEKITNKKFNNLDNLKKLKTGLMLIFIGDIGCMTVVFSPITVLLVVFGMGICAFASAPGRISAIFGFVLHLVSLFFQTVSFLVFVWLLATFDTRPDVLKLIENNNQSVFLESVFAVMMVIATAFYYSAKIFYFNMIKLNSEILNDIGLIKLSKINFVFFNIIGGIFVFFVFLNYMAPSFVSKSTNPDGFQMISLLISFAIIIIGLFGIAVYVLFLISVWKMHNIIDQLISQKT